MEMDSIYMGLQKPSEDVYSTVNQPQGKRAGAEQGDPTAGKAPPYRWAALVLAGLCALSVAAIIFLAVYILSFQTKSLELQSQYSELERNYTNISATVFTLEKNYSNISAKYSALDQYCPVTDTSSKEQVCKACPQNWELFNGKCYYFSTDRMNWNSSRDNCTSLGGHLVIIESDGEQGFLSDKAWNITQEANIINEEKSYWIGLTDAVTEGTWLWVDGTPLIGNDQAKFWATRSDGGKEPDDYKGEDPSGEDCAQLEPKSNSQKTWFDASCTKQYERICETKAVIA
ncbi:CD209 antigen-like protein C isoform X1 [Acipenser oxyrinchus oxyrinchus]|uniref:CD209 antigen-like protein C isoform X1 n=1 Tax=Acipenser oxyrinchus oxyrinchus TaxID=40147 RepID=A0AAD8D685_ACIOX|nr:CD209 antigen-like protein C isoform X1 [Acipenser oxyrinchus oxyrinchus]